MPDKNLPIRNGKVLDIMRSMKDCMTPSARRISDYVNAHPEEVIHSSISELSLCVNAGEATIIRFCRSLNFKGFQDFKMGLAIDLSSQITNEKSILETNMQEEDGAAVLGQKLQNGILHALSETLNLLDFEMLETVVQEIKKAKMLYLFGVGSSGITAEDAKNKFMRIGFSVDALTNNHFMYMKASLLQKGDLAIGISHSGSSIETIKSLKLAKEAGAKTLALTHNPKSSICAHADWVLLNGNHQGQMQGDSIGTKISQLFVLDMLYILLVKNDISGTLNKKQRTTRALNI